MQIRQDSLPVVVVQEDRLPRVATRHDMINRTFAFDAQWSTHGVSRTALPRRVNKKQGLTLIPRTRKGLRTMEGAVSAT